MLSLETGWRSQTPLRPSCFCVPNFLLVRKLLQLCFCWFLGSLLLRPTQYSIFCFLSVMPVGSLRIRKFCTVGYLKMFEAWLGRTFDPVYDYTIDHDYTNILFTYYIFTNDMLLLHIIYCDLWLLYYLRLPCEGAMEDHRIIYHFLHSSSPSKSLTWSCGSYTSESLVLV